MYNIFVIYVPLIIIIVIIGIFIFFMLIGAGGIKRKYDTENMLDKNYKTDYSRLINIYEFLSRFPLTSKSTNQLMDIISGLSMYNNLEQRVETARLAGMSYLICIVLSTLTILFSKGNMMFCVTAFVIALAFRRDFVNKRLTKKRLEFWKDLHRTITSLQQEYERTKSLTSAFSMCQAEESTRFVLANIENIIKSDDPESAIAHFCNNNPFHICIRLAYLCYNTFKFSPKFIEREGVDSFVDGIDTILFDLQTEIDLSLIEKKKFYKVEKLPLVGLLLAFLAPKYLQEYFYGLRYYYNDGFGFLTMIFSMIAIVFAYSTATRLNDRDKTQEDVTAWELKRFEDSDFSNKWLSRAGKNRIMYFNFLIEKSLSYLTPAMIMLRKVIYSLSAFCISFVLIFSYLIIDKKSLETNYKSIPEVVIKELENHYKDYNFVIKKVYQDNSLTDIESITKYFYTQGWNLTDADINAISSQILENKNSMLNVGLNPVHILICFAVMVIFFYMPEKILERRAKLVAYEAKIEVLLLQSVVCQLMYTPLKLKDYLTFFSSISRLYAGTHLMCYIQHFNNPQFLKEEAYKMFDVDYYLLMEELFTLYNSLTPVQIFRTTSSKRRYLAEKNLESRKEKLQENYLWLSALLKGALLIPVLFQIIFPIATFVTETLTQYAGMMPQ